MKKNLIKSIFITTFFLLVVLFLQKNVQAASISIHASKTTINVGESVTITVSSDCIGKVNLSATAGSLDKTSIWVGDATESATLTAKEAGTITVTAQPATLSDGNGTDINNIAPSSCTITVVNNNSNTETTPVATTPATSEQPEEPKKSNNATLSNLGITPNDFKGFTPNKTSYSTSVPNSVSSVNIYANPAKGQENKQKITGTGKKNLQEGVNQFSIVVTAEDGTTKKTYNLSITREAAKEEENKDEENTTDTNTVEEDKEKEDNDEPKIGLSKLTIEGITLSPEFKKDVYEYTAKLIGEKTSLDVKTTAIDEGQIIEVVGNEDLKEGENIITIMVKSADEKETVTYQITVNKSLVDEEAIAREKAEEEMQKQKRQQRLIIIGVIVGAIVIVGGILLVRYVRYRRGSFDDYDDE